ncbi:MAG TPA: cation-translocating P-type ATPase [Verrucomicrobiota bacterium]|nr:cation-translocating P-type ATPase [Verrucomicrobiota bacterium]HQL78506.1 cation-translocating P-type ATPase [Verrucomicrobiota bacterium]
MRLEQTTERHGAGEVQAAPRVGTEFTITGMTCANCARHVTEAIQSVPGVHSAAVRLEAKRAAVRWAGGVEPDVAAVIRAVEGAGFGARIAEAPAAEHAPGGWQLNLWVGVLGTVPIMLGEWGLGLGMTRWFQWLSFGLASVVQFVAGARFYRGAWGQLKVGRSNMDTLVALGSTTAFAYSAWALFSRAGGHVYFMEAAAIITLISVGHWLESRASARASSALRQLLNLAPALARRRDPGGGEREVPVAELRVGDRVVLRPGDRVPTDGEAEEGGSALDESMLTGESAPVDKAPGSRLCAGTVNLNGHLLMRVTATGEETALAHIIAAVQRAQASRADIQRLGDRVSSVFVPLVVAVAVAAGLCWGLAPDWARRAHDSLAPFLWAAHPPEGALAAAFIIAAGVLIVACPCAMGLATPAAVMAGSNAAARRGILIRDGVALEKAGRVTAVLFDKTGTLTTGKAEVVGVWDGGNVLNSGPKIRGGAEEPTSKYPVIDLAAALAGHSSHPVSQAVAKLSAKGAALETWQEVRGGGVQAAIAFDRASPVTARLGSLRWLEDSGVALAAGRDFIAERASQGATVVGVAVESALRGLFAVKDAVKPGARGVVGQLTRQGLKVYLVTGDNVLTAGAIARQTGIPSENVFAQVRPEEKAAFVQRLQRQGQRVAFVGDGINDAPALEQADLGIAVSRASDVAREAADIILLRSEIEAVPESLGLARATLRTIKQNLFWAFFYNAIGVPLAALGFLSPVLCAAAMGLSDLVVIGNALRLRRWRSH